MTESPTSFIGNRLDVIRSNTLPLKLRYSAKVVIHAIPMSLTRSLDIEEEKQKDYSMMRRLYVDAEKGMNYKYAGMMESDAHQLNVGVKDESNPSENEAETVLTMFDNACLEYINAFVFRDYGSRKKYPYITYGTLMPMHELFNLIYVQILWTLTHYQRLEINDDFLFKVTILGAKHYSVVTDLKDPILEINVDETRQKFEQDQYQFDDIVFNYNPLSLGSQNDFDRTWGQMKGDIDQILGKFWNIDRIGFSEWMSQQRFNYSLSEFLKILRSK